MCVIIFKNKKTNLDLNTIKLAYTQNPDGVGVCVNDRGNQWTVYKYLTPSKKDLQDICKLCQDHQAILHFRIATSGGVNMSNCQPFLFDNDRQVLFHNGVMYSLNGICKDRSDTRLLIEIFEGGNVDPHELLTNISKHSMNKFILLDDKNTVNFYGDFKDYKGLWCSNLNFVPVKKPVINLPLNYSEPVFKSREEFFESRKTRWDNDILEDCEI